MAFDSLQDKARDLLDGAVRLRRDAAPPTRGGQRPPVTRERILEEIDDLGLGVTLHESTSGIAALLDGGKPGPTVLLRGDMDALPCTRTPASTSSRTSTAPCTPAATTPTSAMLAGAARLLAARRDDLTGRVVFMFQPGEEGFHGARYMLDEDLLEVGPLPDGSESPVTGGLRLHITSMCPLGVDQPPRRHRSWRRPTCCASSCTGHGGHAVGAAPGPRPHPRRVRDRAGHPDDDHPAHRRVRPGRRHRGPHQRGHHDRTSSPRRPRSSAPSGRCRTRPARRVHGELRRVAEGIAAAHDAAVEVEVELGYPVTVNDLGYAELRHAGGRPICSAPSG